MALIKCKECGNNISTKAKTCPHCGAPNKHGGGCVKIFLGFIVVFAILIFMFSIYSTKKQDRPHSGLDQAIVKSSPSYIESNIPIDISINASPENKFTNPVLLPYELEIGQTYIISKETPLMPSPNSANPLEAIQQIKYIPEGTRFEIIDIYKDGDNPWYKVNAYNQNVQKIGSGWINCIALIGQNLKICPE